MEAVKLKYRKSKIDKTEEIRQLSYSIFRSLMKININKMKKSSH